MSNVPGFKKLPHEEQQLLLGIRLLLAEDSPDNQMIMGRYLRATGAEVELVDDGKQAVAKALAEPFDVILMDVQMPEMDGFEALSKIRESGNQTPIIALTAHSSREDRKLSLQKGFNEHVIKPVNREILYDTILALCRGIRKP